jgi:hypothetical protein
MKKTTIALSLGAGLGILLSVGVASADKLKDMTCDQFLAMDEAQQDDVVQEDGRRRRDRCRL